MTNKDIDKISELLQEVAKSRMHEVIKTAWESSEEEILESLVVTIEFNDYVDSPGPFANMQIVGLLGIVLIMKYKWNEEELMKLLKSSNVDFVKEIKDE